MIDNIQMVTNEIDLNVLRNTGRISVPPLLLGFTDIILKDGTLYVPSYGSIADFESYVKDLDSVSLTVYTMDAKGLSHNIFLHTDTTILCVGIYDLELNGENRWGNVKCTGKVLDGNGIKIESSLDYTIATLISVIRGGEHVN